MADSSKPAVEGGSPVRGCLLKLHSPAFREEELANLKQVLDSGWLTRGPMVERFEQAFCAYRRARFALAVNSCTAALHLAMAVIGTSPGDEIFTSPLTFASTANAILHFGAKPVFADVEPDTLCLSAEKATAAVTPRTKTIMPVHYAGHPCEMDDFLQLGKRSRAFIIEDCAHALEAEFRGVPCGTMGDFGCFSFYATKNITTGEGGMLTCAEERFREAAEVWHLHGMTRAAWERHNDAEFSLYDITEPGFKNNMSELQAALGLAQLPRAETWLARRAKIVAAYDAAFSQMPELRLLKRRPHVKCALHIFPVMLAPDALRISRDQFITAMRAENIQCYVHFPALHLTRLYRCRLGHKPGDFPVAEAAAASLVTLPLFPAMTAEDVQDVITAVTKLVGYYRA